MEFKDALSGISMVGSKTRELVVAASDGDLEKYKHVFRFYSEWDSMRDYSMALILLSPLVVSLEAESKKSDSTMIRSVEAVCRQATKLNLLFTAVGSGAGAVIKEHLNGFTEYKNMLKELSDSKYGGGGESDKFIQRAGKITTWGPLNCRYISTKLVPFLRGIMDTKFSVALRNGVDGAAKMSHEQKTNDNDASVINITISRSEDLGGLAKQSMVPTVDLSVTYGGVDYLKWLDLKDAPVSLQPFRHDLLTLHGIRSLEERIQLPNPDKDLSVISYYFNDSSPDTFHRLANELKTRIESIADGYASLPPVDVVIQ